MGDPSLRRKRACDTRDFSEGVATERLRWAALSSGATSLDIGAPISSERLYPVRRSAPTLTSIIRRDRPSAKKIPSTVWSARMRYRASPSRNSGIDDFARTRDGRVALPGSVTSLGDVPPDGSSLPDLPGPGSGFRRPIRRAWTPTRRLTVAKRSRPDLKCGISALRASAAERSQDNSPDQLWAGRGSGGL